MYTDATQVINTRPLSCDGQETWQHGNSLVNFMKLIEMQVISQEDEGAPIYWSRAPIHWSP